MSHYVKINALTGYFMPKKLTKALRGKRRWIGCSCEGFASSRDLANYVSHIPVKLFDFENNMCIFEVKLEDYNKVKSIFSSGRVISETSSGKIRLVRERMGFTRKPRKR